MLELELELVLCFRARFRVRFRVRFLSWVGLGFRVRVKF